MKKLILTIGLSAFTLCAFAGDLWEWAPGHWSGTDDNGHRYEGWEWAPGHQTWTDDQGNSREIWHWAPGHYDIEDR